MSMLAAALVVIPGLSAQAATYTFYVNSLLPGGDDKTPGDGICATSTGVCTLRAALQESNALNLAPGSVVIAPAADVDSATAGVQSTGTIVDYSDYMVSTGVATEGGDAACYYMATAPVIIDFQNRIGITSYNDSNGACAVYINGPNVKVRNFTNIKSNETAFIVGGNGDNAVIENGSVVDANSNVAERAFDLQTGADNVTIRNMTFGSLWSGGGGAIVIDRNAVIANLTIDRVRMYMPDTEAYYGLASWGYATVSGLRVTNSSFENMAASALYIPYITLSGALISNNVFSSAGGDAPPIWLQAIGTGSSTSRNVIEDNTFRTAKQTKYGIYAVGAYTGGQTAGQTDSYFTIQDNSFDGFTVNSILAYGFGKTTMRRNTIGSNSYYGANVQTGTDAPISNYYYSNNQIFSWVVKSAAVSSCTLSLTVGPSTASGAIQPLGGTANVPAASSVSVDVYWTAVGTAELYLGSSGPMTAQTSFTLPHTPGGGYIRLQTTDSLGRSSQLSPLFSQGVTTDTCAPTVTVDQASSQQDPTSARNIVFSVNTSEGLATSGAGMLTASDFSTAGSTAQGVTVTNVVQLSLTNYSVTAKANTSGTVVLSLPAGAVTDAAGNGSIASTSTDNSVSYVSPLSVSTSTASLTENGASQSYTFANSLSASDTISISSTSANTAIATVNTPSTSMTTEQSTSTPVVLSAVNNAVVDGTRTTSVSFVVTSNDANFDGLVLPSIAVTVADDDTPSAANSTLAVTTGTKIANGTDTHTATLTIRNAAGVGVSGAIATVAVAGGPSPASSNCTSTSGGTCTVNLTSTTRGLFTVTASVLSTSIGSASVRFGAGAASTANSLISVSNSSLTADGSSTATVTVQAVDANGLYLDTGGLTVAILSTAGTVSAVTDNGNGTYTATLTAPTTVSTATVSFTMGGTAGTHTANVSFVPGTISTSRSVIVAQQGSIIANGTSSTTVTVQLRDGQGNPLNISGKNIVVSSTAGTLTNSGTASYNSADGTYTTTLTSSSALATATLSFTVDGSPATSTAQVQFVAGSFSLADSTISAYPNSVTADGSSQSNIVVTLRDAYGHQLTTGSGATVVVTNSGTGTLANSGAATDNGNGTFTVKLTAPITAGTAALGFTVNGSSATATTSVAFLPGAASASNSTIAVSSNSITANGTSTSTVTMTLKDANGNQLTASGGTVTLSSTLGTVGSVTDNNNGTYTATLTSATTAGTATLSFTVSGIAAAQHGTVTFTPGAPSTSNSRMSVSKTSVAANGTDTATVTVTLVDANGNQLTSGGGTVGITADGSALSAPTDNGNGTYTLTLPARTSVGVATIGFTVGGVTASATTPVQFVAGVADPNQSTITAAAPSLTANGTDTTAVTVTLKDASGNALTSSGGTVLVTSTLGTVSTAIDNGNGTYTATLTSATTTGTATLSFKVNGTASANHASVALLAGAIDLGRSTITAGQNTLPANGSSSTTVTVTLLDAFGNRVTSAQTVTIANSLGTISGVTDNSDGTYTATLTSSTSAGMSTVSYTVGGSAGTSTLAISFAAGVASPANSTISVNSSTTTAGGATATVTVTVLDAYGNPVSGVTPVISSTLGATVGTATASNSSGVSTATFTPGTTIGNARLTFTINGSAAGHDATVTITAGGASAANSTIAASPTSIAADGVSTSAITVTLKDASGNPLTTGGDTVTMTSTAGTLGTVSDNGNGTYTAVLTSATTLGDATVSFSVNGTAASAGTTVTVSFVVGSYDLNYSGVSASPTSITADGSSTSTVTVQLRDSQGHPLTTGGASLGMVTTAGTLSSVTDHNNGSYTATLTSGTLVTNATVSFSVAGNTAPSTAVVHFVAGSFDLSTSTISAGNSSLVADGTSVTTMTVTLRDAQGTRLTTGGQTVAFSTDRGTLVGTAADNNDGTYTIQLRSGTSAGTATVGFTVGGSAGSAQAQVDMLPGNLDLAHSTITASPTSLTANGSSTSVITVTLRDANDNVLRGGGHSVTVSTTAGAVTANATDQNNGTYTTTLTSATVAGTSTQHFAVDGTNAAATSTVSFVAGAASAANSLIAASPTSIVANGSATSAVTVTLRDANSNILTSSGGTVEVLTTGGSIGAVTDNLNGTYTALLTAPTATGSATLSFKLNGTVGTATAGVTFVAGSASAANSTISAAAGSIAADGTSQTIVTVNLKDAQGNQLATGGQTVVLTTTLGTLSAVSDRADGSYTAVLTSSTTAGAATVSFTVGGTPGPAAATVNFTPGAASAANSTITASPSSIVANGSSTSTVTVILRDANNNRLTGGGATVTITSNRGSVGSVTDHNDGSYTAQLTSGTQAGAAVVGFTVNSVTASASTTVQMTAGAVDAAHSTISVSAGSIPADGASTATVTAILKDANGNTVDTNGASVVFSTDAGTVGSSSYHTGGSYTATLTAGTAPKAVVTVGMTINGTVAPATATLAFTAGAVNLSQSTISAAASSLNADGGSTTVVTVVLRDTFGNQLGVGGATVTMATTLGGIGTVSDHGDGSYTATFTSGWVGGTAVQSFKVAGVSAPATASITQVAAISSTYPTVNPTDGSGISGTAQPNSTVTISDAAGNVLCTAVADATGHFSCTPNRVLVPGERISVISTDANGNQSQPTTVVVQPTTPTVLPSDGSVISGGAQPGATVEVKDAGGNVLCTAVADSTGHFSCVPHPTPDAGERVTVTAELNGETSQPIAVNVAPPTPTVLPSDGTVVAGTAKAGLTVTVRLADGTVVCTATANIHGAYSCTPSTPLAVGTPITVAASDMSGNVSQPVATVMVPAAPGVDPTDGTVVTGVARANETITIRASDGTVLGTTTANGSGVYSWTPTTRLTAGTQVSVTASETVAGVLYTSQPTVRTSANVSPVVNPSDGSGISGVVVPGKKVVIEDAQGNVLCETVAASDGRFTCSPLTPKPDSGDQISIISMDTNGSNPSAPTTITVVPTSPTVLPTDGSSISGSAAPGLRVDVKDAGGNILCTATADSAGHFSCTPNPHPGSGDVISIISTDTNGNHSQPTTITVVPITPTVLPSDGSSISGSAAPGLRVDVKDAGGNVLCTAVADRNGHFSCTPNPHPGSGDVISIVSTDTNGNHSQPTTITVVPITPTVLPSDGSSISGSAAPGLRVDVKDAGGNILCTATADSAGHFSCVPNPHPGSGDVISIVSTDTNGNHSQPTTITVVPITPTVLPSDGSSISGSAAPGLRVDVKDAGGNVLCTAVADGNGHFSCTPNPHPGSGDVISIVSTDTNGNHSQPTTITVVPITPTVLPSDGSSISGSAAPGLRVDVKDAGGNVLCTAVADGNGHFSCTPNPHPGSGDVISIISTDTNGNHSQPTTITVVPTSPTVLPTDGSSISGSAAPGSRVDVKDAGGNVLCTAFADGNGHFSCTPNPHPGSGDVISIISTDTNGNHSQPTTITVVPSSPTVLPTDGSSISGSAAPGLRVDVKDAGGNVLCTAVADRNGHFSCTPNPHPGSGDVISIVSTDTNGNHSQPTTITVVPITPTVLPSDGSSISGSAAPGLRVDVKDAGGNILCTATADSAGHFSCVPNPHPGSGDVISIVSTDTNGNHSQPTTITVVPITPTVLPSDGSSISGSAAPGLRVDVKDAGGNVLCTAVADGNGHFSCTPNPHPGSGDVISIVSTDTNGNQSQPIRIKVLPAATAATTPAVSTVTPSQWYSSSTTVVVPAPQSSPQSSPQVTAPVTPKVAQTAPAVAPVAAAHFDWRGWLQTVGWVIGGLLLLMILWWFFALLRRRRDDEETEPEVAGW